MPNKSIPTIGDPNWGTPLNAHLSQLQNPTNGGINTFEQFSGRPTNLTTDDVGKTYLYTQTGNIHQWTGTAWKVLNESVINVKDYGAVGDGVVDDTAAVQSCIDLAKSSISNQKLKIIFTAGKYRITSTLNLTIPSNTPPSDGSAIHIEFDRRSALNQSNTYLVGETGNNPVIETTGSYGITFDNLSIYSGTNNPSKIGILHARQGLGGAFRHLYRNVVINLASNLTANSNFGSVALVNISGEEAIYENIELTANTCYIHSTSDYVRRVNTVNSQYTGLIEHVFSSAFGIPLASGVTSTAINFSGMCRFRSLDWIGPIVLIHNPDNNFDSSTIDFGTTFMEKVYSSGTLVSGIYDYAFEVFNMRLMKHFGQMEGCGRYMILHGALDFSEILTYDGGNTPVLNTLLPYSEQRPFIWLWPLPNLQHTITNTSINFYNQREAIPMLRWNGESESNLVDLPYVINNFEFKTSSVYTKDIISKGIYKSFLNSRLSFYDKKITIGKNTIDDLNFVKNIGKTNSSPTLIFKIDLPNVSSQSDLSGVCEMYGTLSSNEVDTSSIAQFVCKFSYVRNTQGYFIGISTPLVTIQN